MLPRFEATLIDTVPWRGSTAERPRRREFVSPVRPAPTVEELARLEPFLTPPSR